MMSSEENAFNEIIRRLDTLLNLQLDTCKLLEDCETIAQYNTQQGSGKSKLTLPINGGNNSSVDCRIDIKNPWDSFERFLKSTTEKNTTYKEPRRSLLFSGMDEVAEEHLSAAVISIVCNVMNVEITEADIRFCYRYKAVGPKVEQPIMVRFQSRYVYSLVWKARHMLQDSDIDVVVHVPMKMRSLFEKVQRNFGVGNSLVYNGEIFLLTPDCVIHNVQTELELNKMIKTYFDNKIKK